jgi:hypothetical protein
MAFAGIFQPFARLRWIRFGLLMRDRKLSRRFSVPQTTALAPLPFANRTITSVAWSAAPLRACPGEGAHRQGKLRRNAGEGAAGLSKGSRAGQQRKQGRQEVRGEEGETKE